MGFPLTAPATLARGRRDRPAPAQCRISSLAMSDAVLVTGSSTGIGRACALRLEALGFTVYAGVRREEDGLALKEIAGPNLHPLLLDVTDMRAIDTAVELMRTDRRVARLAGIAGVTELYGRVTERMTTIARRQEQHGLDPARVANAVAHALTAARPRTRYLVGSEARITLLLRRALPDRWWDELVLRIAGLPRSRDADA